MSSDSVNLGSNPSSPAKDNLDFQQVIHNGAPRHLRQIGHGGRTKAGTHYIRRNARSLLHDRTPIGRRFLTTRQHVIRWIGSNRERATARARASYTSRVTGRMRQ